MEVYSTSPDRPVRCELMTLQAPLPSLSKCLGSKFEAGAVKSPWSARLRLRQKYLPGNEVQYFEVVEDRKRDLSIMGQ